MDHEAHGGIQKCKEEVTTLLQNCWKAYIVPEEIVTLAQAQAQAQEQAAPTAPPEAPAQASAASKTNATIYLRLFCYVVKMPGPQVAAGAE